MSQARVALARAVYHEADVYLLDDPLSAVDAHVGKHLFNKCIVDCLLKGCDKTVILVTNALQFLNHQLVNKIIVLEGGAIKEEGTYDELMGKEGGSFSTLLKTYREKVRSAECEERKTGGLGVLGVFSTVLTSLSLFSRFARRRHSPASPWAAAAATLPGRT